MAEERVQGPVNDRRVGIIITLTRVTFGVNVQQLTKDLIHLISCQHADVPMRD
jgi:hypothetical protein